MKAFLAHVTIDVKVEPHPVALIGLLALSISDDEL